MKAKLRRKAPARPSYNGTTTRPFKIILITGSIAKISGCLGKLKKRSQCVF